MFKKKYGLVYKNGRWQIKNYGRVLKNGHGLSFLPAKYSAWSKNRSASVPTDKRSAGAGRHLKRRFKPEDLNLNLFSEPKPSATGDTKSPGWEWKELTSEPRDAA